MKYHLRNIGNYLTVDMAQYLRKFLFLLTSQLENCTLKIKCKVKILHFSNILLGTGPIKCAIELARLKQ